MKVKPDLSFWKLWNISFGFFGVQIAYALQSANISRIFATLGADPHTLSYFWILPPLAGIIVQPIVGAASDRTWTRFGRRIPYLFIGSLIAVLVMCLLPNAGSFGMSVGTAMIFGLFALMFLDTSINMAMQPFKMMVGDMVNEKQKGLAYSIQSFLCNAGSLVGYLFPFIFTAIGISNTAPQGVIPDSVIYSFYIGAVILIFCVIYTSVKVKEMPPTEYAEYHGITEEQEHEKVNMLKLLIKAPKAFWTVGLVQFFCWFAFMFMWTYTNGSVAHNAFDTPPATKINSITENDKEIPHKFIEVEGKLIVKNFILLNDDNMQLLTPNASLFVSDNAQTDDDGVTTLINPIEYIVTPQTSIKTSIVLNTESKNFQDAGNWVGVLFAVQAIGSVLWAICIPLFKNRRLVYSLSLVLGGIGFISTYFIHDPYTLFFSFVLIGCAWAAMLALPFTILTNSLSGSHMGTYLGLFNGTICIPQIVAASLGGSILALFTPEGCLPPEINMLVTAGVMLLIGAVCVYIIKEGRSE